MAWFALVLAVVFNVVANVSLKLAVTGDRSGVASSGLRSVLLNPWLWLGGLSCVLLLLSYLYALRGIGLGTAYGIVTSAALVAVSVASALIFGEQFTVAKGIGVLAVMAGIFLISTASS